MAATQRSYSAQVMFVQVVSMTGIHPLLVTHVRYQLLIQPSQFHLGG